MVNTNASQGMTEGGQEFEWTTEEPFEAEEVTEWTTEEPFEGCSIEE